MQGTTLENLNQEDVAMLMFAVRSTSRRLQKKVTNLNYEIQQMEYALYPREKLYKLCVEDFAIWKRDVEEIKLMKEKRNYILADIRRNGALLKKLKEDATQITQPAPPPPSEESESEDEMSKELF
jgi:hypothetical protein